MTEIKDFRRGLVPLKIEDFGTPLKTVKTQHEQLQKVISEEQKVLPYSEKNGEDTSQKVKKRSKWGLIRAVKNILSINVELNHAKELGKKWDEMDLEYEFSPQRTKKPRPLYLGSDKDSPLNLRKNKYSMKDSDNAFTKCIIELRLQKKFHFNLNQNTFLK